MCKETFTGFPSYKVLLYAFLHLLLLLAGVVQKLKFGLALIVQCPHVVDENAPKYSGHYQLSHVWTLLILVTPGQSLHHNYQPTKEH